MSDVWGWFGLPMAGEGQEFETPAVAWTEHDWLASLGYQMANETAPETGQPFAKRFGGVPGMGIVSPGFTHTW